MLGVIAVKTVSLHIGTASVDLNNLSDTMEPAIKEGFEPAYLKLHKSGELKERANLLWERLSECDICPRLCGADRLSGETGYCGAEGTNLRVSSFHAHFGEERPLVGSGGSGTIFFTHCGLKCVFCQNYEISHLGRGSGSSAAGLAEMMLMLQQRGAHNINLVTPTHFTPHILKALDIAASNGLRLPLVYNTSGWERLEIIKLLDGVVDIYLPDFKYWDEEIAAKYSPGAKNYPAKTRDAILEMHRQVGRAHPDEDGIIYRGLMIRVLVMPGGVSGSEEVISWISENLPKDTYVNIMAQYSPRFRAYDYPDIARRVTREEYRNVLEKAEEVGLTNLDARAFRWFGR